MKTYDKEIEKLQQLSTYTYLSKTYIEEISSMAVIMEHKKTKARILLMLTQDNNKVFTIGFRTPSLDSTGVAHIMEHSVLCGSRKFPLKDPFVELVKGSLNTFLNAMTYMDKTLYPVASCNDKDFQNLMDVYLDAVLYPNIYKEEKIFLQEGWHYELEDENSELSINGVVYNEMKGAFSSPDAILERTISKGLFENHSYGEESGGDPDFIPDLSYENFLDFHRRYYHPSNSFIYLYGNMDMLEKLEFIDREYLSNFDYKEVDSKIKDVTAFSKPKTLIEEYSITADESLENATYLSIHTMVGAQLEPVKAFAFKILEYLLIDAPAAIIKTALQEAKIGEDCLGTYEFGIAYPYFSIIAKNANIDKKEEFLEVINKCLKKIVKEGIDKERLYSAINVFEFRTREGDFGSYPKGLIYALSCFNSWLYDADPCMHLKYNEIFENLKKEVENNYFENLIEDLLLNNNFKLELILKPSVNLVSKKDEKLREKLADIKAKMSDEQIQKLILDTKALKEYQSSIDSDEAIKSLPVLKREEINKSIEKVEYELDNLKLDNTDITMIYSDIDTLGISYLKFIFNISSFDKENLQYLTLLKEIFTYVNTDKYSYERLDTLINLYMGSLNFTLDSYVNALDLEDTTFNFNINIKLLSSNFKKAMELVKEITLNSKLEDTQRIKDIIFEIKSANKSKILSSGHISAINKAASYISKENLFADITRGIDFYKFIEDLALNFDTKKEYIINKLQYLIKVLFTKDKLSINFIGSRKDYDICLKNCAIFVNDLPTKTCNTDKSELVFEASNKSLAYTSSSMVNYAALVGTYKNSNLAYTGLLRVLKVLLSYDFLWTNIRIMGGAYGAMSNFSRNKNIAFVSYRDPKILETYATYDKVKDFIKNFKADEREIDKLVIGAISELDIPLTPYMKGMKALGLYFSNIDNDLLQKERDEILNASLIDIQNLYKYVEIALNNSSKVCIGNEEKIKETWDYFEEVNALYKD